MILLLQQAYPRNTIDSSALAAPHKFFHLGTLWELHDKHLQAVALLEDGALRLAQSALERTLELWRQAGRLAGPAYALRLLALVAQRSQLPLLAREYLLQALDASRTLSDEPLQAALLADLGRTFTGLGETDRAITHYSQAGLLYERLADRAGESRMLLAIGKAHHEAGDAEAAIPFFQWAFPLLRGTDSWTEEVAASVITTKPTASHSGVETN